MCGAETSQNISFLPSAAHRAPGGPERELAAWHHCCRCAQPVRRNPLMNGPANEGPAVGWGLLGGLHGGTAMEVLHCWEAGTAAAAAAAAVTLYTRHCCCCHHLVHQALSTVPQHDQQRCHCSWSTQGGSTGMSKALHHHLADRAAARQQPHQHIPAHIVCGPCCFKSQPAQGSRMLSA